MTHAPNRTEVFLSPRFGIVRSLARSYASPRQRLPRISRADMNELYRTGQVGSEITHANASLQSERATGWEIGARYASTHNSPSLPGTYFWTEINRPVSAVLVSQTATTLTNMRENLGQIRSRGVELSAQLRPGKAVSGSFGYQFARATVTQFPAQSALVGNWIPEVPRHSVTAQLRGSSPRVGELTLATRVGGRAFDDANNQFPLSGFYSVDLSGRHAFGQHLEATFLVQNLTNQRAEVARTPTLTFGSPIFAEAGLRWHLSR